MGESMSMMAQAKPLIERELSEVNALTGRYGLTLSDRQIARIAQKRIDALKDNGRVEFGAGILKALLYAFCDSPYIVQADYEETIASLIDSFYYFKNESEDMISDEELIDMMRFYFNDVCHGSLEFLDGTTLPDLCRAVREADL